MPRDEFSIEVKRRLAQRAGYLCSICSNITVGPSDETHTSVNLIGVAAHISAASEGPGSRRYDSVLTSKERSSIDNGIWLCNTHADLIDGDETTYTTSYLKFIKETHEQKIKFRLSGISVDKGVITKIELSNFGQITSPVVLEFTDRNIIYGNNGVGKTLILELIASLSDKSYLERWTDDREVKANSFCNVYYFKNQLDKFSLAIDNKDRVLYSFNDTEIPFLVPTMTILFISESYWDYLRSLTEDEKEDKSLVKLLSSYFRLSEDEFVNVIGGIMRDKKFFFNDINFNEQKDDLIVKVSDKLHSPAFSFRALSGGEQDRVLLEITLKIAYYHAKFNSTILLIENTSFGTLDSRGINSLFDILRNEQPNFQFFFTTIPNTDYDVEGFKVYELFVTDKKNVAVQVKKNMQD
ncbi:hypothetical protein NYQ10_10145 [Flavobacterium johnsoniae]|uniref:AAA family ATPase n=1 Tax=Flavobacterium johnsoniae TaxID=986 RepID=UPI0025B13F24|nr:AAA family ATPase [Flavobacterium johnsoniae]WJS96796.1 hypothetical protein NYQ10_10145 [Flavobacterium johnsoniae]